MKKILLLCICLVSLNAFAQIPTNGLMGFYPFENNFKDSSMNHINGTGSSMTFGGGRDNAANSSAYFDGNSHVFIPNYFDYKKKTVSLWFKPANLNATTILMVADNPSLKNGLFYISLLPNANSKNLRIAQGDVADTLTIANDIWSHIIVTVDSPSYKIYLNGILKKSGSRTSNITSVGGLSGTVLGSNRIASGNYFEGHMDNLRVYNRVLDSVELLNLKHEFTANCLFTDTIKVIETTHVTVYDTTYVSVTDTLFIKALLSGINPPQFSDIKIYPNPTKSSITIDVANLNTLMGYKFKLISNLGVTVYQANITQASNVINLSTWAGLGTYTLQLIDPQNKVIAIKKIILN